MYIKSRQQPINVLMVIIYRVSVYHIGFEEVAFSIYHIIRYQSRDVIYPVLKGSGFAKHCPLKRDI